jgi:hypothetical protein
MGCLALSPGRTSLAGLAPELWNIDLKLDRHQRQYNPSGSGKSSDWGPSPSTLLDPEGSVARNALSADRG